MRRKATAAEAKAIRRIVPAAIVPGAAVIAQEAAAVVQEAAAIVPAVPPVRLVAAAAILRVLQAARASLRAAAKATARIQAPVIQIAVVIRQGKATAQGAEKLSVPSRHLPLLLRQDQSLQSAVNRLPPVFLSTPRPRGRKRKKPASRNSPNTKRRNLPGRPRQSMLQGQLPISHIGRNLPPSGVPTMGMAGRYTFRTLIQFRAGH